VQTEAPNYRLCKACAARQGASERISEGKDDECFICGGLFSAVPGLAVKAAQAAKPYQFASFAIGVILPEGVQEREDELRSEIKAKGGESVKTHFSRLLTALVSTKVRRKVDKSRPDLLALVDAGRLTATVSVRPVYFFARYTKPSGLRQRKERCGGCGGRGCERCRGTGFARVSSVEDAVGTRLLRESGAGSFKFMWIGSEDKESEVLPPGRPFVVELKGPLVRKVPRRFVSRGKGWQVSVTGGRRLPSKPTVLPSFRIVTRATAVTRRMVTLDELQEVRRTFRDAEVVFDRPGGRPIMKKVYRASASRLAPRSLEIRAELDGGLPVKRFVDGGSVSPSVSEVLKTDVGCRRFDVCRVKLTGDFRFA
jgi:tRNA pseudouridine synthase 10